MLCHEDLVPLYAKAGFELLGPSAVQHGQRPWLEMQVNLLGSAPPPPPTQASTSTSAGATAESKDAAPAEVKVNEEMADDNGKNKTNLYCPRKACRCLILKRGAATWLPGDARNFQVRLSISFRPPLSAVSFLLKIVAASVRAACAAAGQRGRDGRHQHGRGRARARVLGRRLSVDV